jgi:protein gp37
MDIMATRSSIEWTDSTWNPVTGCTKVSPGCKNCYAERMAHRLRLMGQPRYQNGFRVKLQRDIVEAPLSWRGRRTIFVNSMSDLFHEDIPLEFIQRVFATMNKAHHHRFQILTKRSKRLLELRHAVEWTKNIWMGVSVENASYTFRVRDLQKVPAKVRFLSVEPLLGKIPSLPLSKIHWVIVGGESGPRARPMQTEWVRQIRDRCLRYYVPFFFKQWGGFKKKAAGRELDGKTWDGMPPKLCGGDNVAGSFARQVA